MPQHFSQELLRETSRKTLTYAEQVFADIDAALNDPDSNYYLQHYLGYKANLTAYLGGEAMYDTWLRKTFQGRDRDSITWQALYEKAHAACSLIERHAYHPAQRQSAIDALRNSLLVND